jgi:O-methyltransferase domain/Dimerisation domain
VDDNRVRLEQLLLAYQWSQVLITAVRLGVVDALGDSPTAVVDLATQLGVDPDGLRRVLRCLAALGIAVAERDDRFGAGPATSLLRRGAPGSLADLALLGVPMTAVFAELGTTLTTGGSAFEAAYGEPLFAYFGSHAEDAAVFDGTMTAMSNAVIESFVPRLDVAGASGIVDVGGGVGHLGASIADAYPSLDVTILDLQQVEDRANAFLSQGAGSRCRFVAGDFFEAVPAGRDVHILKWVLHDWSDGQCVQILDNCRNALSADGRVVIIERVVPDPVGRTADAEAVVIFDVAMLAMFGAGAGRERTLTEYDTLVQAAGLVRTQVTPLAAQFVAITASQR